MNRKLTFLTAAALSAGLLAAPAAHADWYRRGGGWHGGGWHQGWHGGGGGGIVAGALLGLGAAAVLGGAFQAPPPVYYAPPPYYPPAPGYYAPPPGYYPPPPGYYAPGY